MISLARTEAKNLNHEYLGTEHILLALLSEKGGVAGRLFKQREFSVEQMRADIMKVMHPLSSPSDSQIQPSSVEPSIPGAFTLAEEIGHNSGDWLVDFTPRANQVRQLARKEAERLQQNYVGVEHLLIGLIGLGDGTAFDLLKSHGLDLEKARLEIEKLIGVLRPREPQPDFLYSPRARHALTKAKEEAKSLKNGWVGTEHIFLDYFIIKRAWQQWC